MRYFTTAVTPLILLAFATVPVRSNTRCLNIPNNGTYFFLMHVEYNCYEICCVQDFNIKAPLIYLQDGILKYMYVNSML